MGVGEGSSPKHSRLCFRRQDNVRRHQLDDESTRSGRWSAGQRPELPPSSPGLCALNVEHLTFLVLKEKKQLPEGQR